MTTYSVDTYTGDGSTVDFSVTFKFIQRSHVEVYRVDTASKVETKLTFTTNASPTGDEYIWVTDQQITVGTAPTAAQELKIKRDTPEDIQLVQWADGSYIVAADLNESDKQWLYNIQELEDGKASIDGSVSGAAVKSVTGTAPITVDNTNAQTPVIGIDETKAADDPNLLVSDTDVMSELAIDGAFAQLIGDGANFPPAGYTGKVGKIRIDNTGATPKLFYWSGSTWVQVASTGPQGPEGPAGPAPGLQNPPASAASVPLNGDGSLGTATADVLQDPTTKDLKFLFGIPVGQKGDKGDKGADSTVPGPPPGLQSPAATAIPVPNKPDGSVGDPAASVTQDGNGDLRFAFEIPTGEKGDPGPPGEGVDYKGSIDATTTGEPNPKANGDFWINTTAGTSSWTGLSTVTVNDRLIYNGNTNQWDRYTPPPVSGVDLNYIASTTSGTVNNTAGTNAIIPVVGSMAGLMIPADKTKLDGIQDGAQANPDLSNYLQKNDNVSELTNDAGYITLAQVPPQTTPTLQQVLDEGNTSTTELWIGSGGNNVTLRSNGTVEAKGFRIDQLTTLP